MNVCLNEDRRLTKRIPRQLLTKILVTSSSSLKPHLFLIYFISNSEDAFNKNTEITEKHSEVLVCLIP